MRANGRQAMLAPSEMLQRTYHSLLKELGPQGWWPARTRLEIILGAVLTQNTSWNNVRLALKGLRAKGLLRWASLRRVPRSKLEFCIRPAGFYRQKAQTIMTFVKWVEDAHGASLNRFLSQPIEESRRQLLNLRGFGPETADAILLYASKAPIFVADAYTRRVLSRHGLLPANATYAEAQNFVHRYLERDEAIYNEFHALLVETGKLYCRAGAPRCSGCPLEPLLEVRPAGGIRASQELGDFRRSDTLNASSA